MRCRSPLTILFRTCSYAGERAVRFNGAGYGNVMNHRKHSRAIFRRQRTTGREASKSV